MKYFIRLVGFMVVLTLGTLNVYAGSGHYHIVQQYPLPGDGKWSYLTLDESSRRLFIPHGAEVQVFDIDAGRVVGEFTNAAGYAVAVVPELKRAFTSNQNKAVAVAFDLPTLKTVSEVPVEDLPEFILYDSFTKRVFLMHPETTVLDAKSGAKLGAIELDADTQVAVSDEAGTIYVNLDKTPGELAVIDAQAMKMRNLIKMPFCNDPHSLSYDRTNKRLLVGCSNGLNVLDPSTGELVGWSPICGGEHASAFDPDAKLLFVACNEGVVSVVQQLSANDYVLIDTVNTQIGSNAIAFDRKTKRLFLLGEQWETVATDEKLHHFKQKRKPGTFSVLVLGRD